MRSGACAVQQTLTNEAASLLKHSLSLARRRGHAQVTPLHVAATLLSSRTNLLRRACLKSQHSNNHQLPHHHHQASSHPLQCRALELCFNVALNRLPTTPGPILHGQPSLSNALIAALKRAQAHQRRGCVEHQQQPLLTIKVELEQLIISILDDPSVSRVMREAGFSSTTIKSHVEHSAASSVFQCFTSSNTGGVFSSPCSHTSTEPHLINPNPYWQNPHLFSLQRKPASSVNEEDIKLVFEVFLRKKRRNTVILGDCLSTTEALVLEFMGRVEKGDVPQDLQQSHIIKFHFAPVTLRFMKKEDVEMNLRELKRKVDSLTSVGGGGAIIYTGDLKWTVDHQESSCNKNFNGECYSPINHLISEIGKLVSDYNSSSNTRVWLMATSSDQTYMKCQMRQPPLEIQWALEAISVPSAGLSLSLHSPRVTFSQNLSQVWETKPFVNKEEEDHKLGCCAECTADYEKEAQLLESRQKKLLPPWLQSHTSNANQKDELEKKWNRLCQSLHQRRDKQSQFSSNFYSNQSVVGKNYSYASMHPWWPSHSSVFQDSDSISLEESAMKPLTSSNSVAKFRRQQSCTTIEFNFGICTESPQGVQPSLDSLKSSEDKEVRVTLSLGNCELSDSENLKRSGLQKILQENFPWQFDSIQSIVEAFIGWKSTNKGNWFLLKGNDTIGKRRLALATAASIFGSADFLFHINMRKTNDVGLFSEQLMRKLKNCEKLVVLVENVDFADGQFMKILADGFETGKFGQVIFVLTKGDSSNDEDRMKHRDSVINMTLAVDERNQKKRKGEWNFSNNMMKNARVDEKEVASSVADVSVSSFSKKDSSSFNTLDLNMKANDQDDETEAKLGGFTHISSDLPNGFLDLIQNRFVLNRNSSNDGELTGPFLAKMEDSFADTFKGHNKVNFSIEERVLEEVLIGSSFFLNSLFEKWLKEVFQASLEAVKTGGKEKVIEEIRLCFRGIDDKVYANYGFEDSCLPKKIQLGKLCEGKGTLVKSFF